MARRAAMGMSGGRILHLLDECGVVWWERTPKKFFRRLCWCGVMCSAVLFFY